MTREQMIERVRVLDDKYYALTREELQERKRLLMALKQCKCRQCGKVYDHSKSRADYTGYCSQKCMRDRAKHLGYRKGRDLYKVLVAHQAVGNLWEVK